MLNVPSWLPKPFASNAEMSKRKEILGNLKKGIHGFHYCLLVHEYYNGSINSPIYVKMETIKLANQELQEVLEKYPTLELNVVTSYLVGFKIKNNEKVDAEVVQPVSESFPGTDEMPNNTQV